MLRGVTAFVDCFVFVLFEWTLDSKIQCLVGPWWGSASIPRVGVMNTLLPTSEEMGHGVESYDQFNPNTTYQLWFNTTDAQNSAELKFGLTGGSLWQPHCPKDQPAPPEGFGIDPRLGAAALRAPAASKEDSRPHAILKFHRPSSLDYRVRHELPIHFHLSVLNYTHMLLVPKRLLNSTKQFCPLLIFNKAKKDPSVPRCLASLTLNYKFP